VELESRPCAPTPLLKTLDDMKHNNRIESYRRKGRRMSLIIGLIMRGDEQR
jgi:hypothetical protein